MLLLATTVGSCRGCEGRADRPDSPSLADVTVTPVPVLLVQKAPIAVDGRVVQEKVRSLLEGAAVFASPRAGRPTAQATIQAELLDATESEEPAIGVKVRFRVSVRPSHSSATRFAEDVEAMGEARLSDTDAARTTLAFQRLFERTTEDVVKAYVARQRLWQAPASEIDSALRSDDSEIRVEALRIIATRGLRGRSETLIRLLADEDENVRDAALGAVVALREQRAVKVLAESRSMRDTREMKKIINAIAVLGGSEAWEYLTFVAQNHDDPEVRDMAKQALDKFASKAASSSATK